MTNKGSLKEYKAIKNMSQVKAYHDKYHDKKLFFSKETMAFFGDTLRSFRLETLENGDKTIIRKRTGKTWKLEGSGRLTLI